MKFFFLFLSLGFFLYQTSSSEAQSPSFPFQTFFSEQVLKVSSESDNLSPGTFRSALLKASALRRQDAFTLVEIQFESSVKKIVLEDNPLPALDFGHLKINCSGVLFDASKLSSYSVLHLNSSGNRLIDCYFSQFRQSAIRISGSENIISGNHFSQAPQGRAIDLDKQGSWNKITNSIFEKLQEGIQFSASSGWSNQISQNHFSQIQGAEIRNSNSPWDSAKAVLMQASNLGSLVELTGSLSEAGSVEIYRSSGNRQWVSLGSHAAKAGNFKIEISAANLENADFAVVNTSVGKNSSEFSNSVQLIPHAGQTGSAAPTTSAPSPPTPAHTPPTFPPGIDPLLNSTTIPPAEAVPPPSSNPAPEQGQGNELNLPSDQKSGPSDSLKVESVEVPLVP